MSEAEAAAEASSESGGEGAEEYKNQMDKLNDQIREARENGDEEALDKIKNDQINLSKDRINKVLSGDTITDADRKSLTELLKEIDKAVDLEDLIENPILVPDKTPTSGMKILQGICQGAADSAQKFSANASDEFKAADAKSRAGSQEFLDAANEYQSSDKSQEAKNKFAEEKEKFRKVQVESNEAYEKEMKSNPTAADEATATGEDSSRTSKAWFALKWMSILGGIFGTCIGLKLLADSMTGCYKYTGMKSQQLDSCHGIDGVEKSCSCGAQYSGTGGATGSGTCGCSNVDCGGQVYCPRQMCQKCPAGACADAYTSKACGCAPGPACDGTISYTYIKYNPWTVVPGLFDQAAGYTGSAAIAWIKTLLYIAVAIAIIVVIYVVLRWLLSLSKKHSVEVKTITSE